jgi:hypothetical protein
MIAIVAIAITVGTALAAGPTPTPTAPPATDGQGYGCYGLGTVSVGQLFAREPLVTVTMPAVAAE